MARLEDSRKIITVFQEMIRGSRTTAQYQEIYFIEILNGFRDFDIPTALDRIPRVFSCITAHERLESEISKIYTEEERGSDFKGRVFFEIPEENNMIRNLHVPFDQLSTAFVEVKRLLFRNHHSNIHVVKVVSLKRSMTEGIGVRTDRKEDIIINSVARNKIPERIVELTQQLLFNKYLEDLISIMAIVTKLFMKRLKKPKGMLQKLRLTAPRGAIFGIKVAFMPTVSAGRCCSTKRAGRRHSILPLGRVLALDIGHEKTDHFVRFSFALCMITP